MGSQLYTGVLTYFFRVTGNFSKYTIALTSRAVFSFICTTTIDRVHLQNKDSEVTVYTKRSAEAMEQAILSGLQRGVTLMHGTGAYTGEDVNVLTITLSEYELPMLRQLIARFDPHAFVVVKPRVKVFGNYLKKL